MVQKRGLDLGSVGKVGAGGARLPGGSMKDQEGLRISPRRKGSFTQRREPGQSGERKKVKPRPATIAKVACLVIASLALAVGVGAAVYQQTVKSSICPEIDYSALAAALAEVDADDASWTLIARTSPATAEEGRGTVVSLGLVYLNPDAKTISCLWIPSNTRVYIDGYGYHTLGETTDLLGESGLVAAVKKLSGVQAAHYMEINQGGVRRLVSSLALDVDADDADNRMLASAVVAKVAGSSKEQIKTQAQAIGACVAADFDAAGLASALQSLQGMDMGEGFRSQDMPVSQSGGADEDGKDYSVVDGESWATMVARVQGGMTPVASEDEKSDNEELRSTHRVTIWNGVGVAGVADDCKTQLQKLGWQIESTGNAAQFVYTETLVVYKDDGEKSLAELLVSDLGQGRVVRSAARYSFEGDVLVVVGKDYQPY